MDLNSQLTTIKLQFAACLKHRLIIKCMESNRPENISGFICFCYSFGFLCRKLCKIENTILACSLCEVSKGYSFGCEMIKFSIAETI